MKKPMPIAKRTMPSRPGATSMRDRLVAGAAVFALLLCAGLGIRFTLKHRKGESPSVASAPEAPAEIPSTKQAAAVKKQPKIISPKNSALPVVEQLTVEPREFDLWRDFWTLREPEGINRRPRNDVVGKLPEVEAPPVNRESINLGPGIPFYTNVRAAGDEARRLNEFVFVLEYVGFVENGQFSSKAAMEFQRTALRKKPVIDYLSGNKKKVAFSCSLRAADDRWATGDHVIIYLCQPDGIVLHAMIDPDDDRLMKGIRWLERTHDSTRHPKKGREFNYLDQFKAAHLRAAKDDEEEAGQYSRRLHELLAKALAIDELDERIWTILLK